jgi:uncharacterized protein YoxC
VGRSDRRLLVGALCGISLTLAAALVLGQPRGSLAVWSRELARGYWPDLWHLLRSPGRKGWATIVQFVGTTITFGGLGTAYLRARHGITVKVLAKRAWGFVRRQWAKLLRRPSHQTIKAVGIESAEQFGTHAVMQVTHNVDTSLSVQEQINRLVQFVNNRSAELSQLESQVSEVRRAVSQAREHATDLATKTLAHIETQIQQLRSDLDKVQVLDLRCAIAGLAVTFVGIALGYGT